MSSDSDWLLRKARQEDNSWVSAGGIHRHPVQIFVSYALQDERVCARLLEQLRVQMAPSARYDYRMWNDQAILVGEKWEQQIMRSITESDIGLLLVSPAFLTSKYITDTELTRFIGDESKPVIPVEVEAVGFAKQDLKGLQHYQLFRLDRHRSFAMCTGSNLRRFAEKLYEQVERRLDRLGR